MLCVAHKDGCFSSPKTKAVQGYPHSDQYLFIYAFFPSRNAISTAGQAGHLDDLASFFKSSFFTKTLMQFSKNWEQISFMLNM